MQIATVNTADVHCSKEPFPFLVWQNFLDLETCRTLITDAETFSAGARTPYVMGGRSIMASTSVRFTDLGTASPIWSSLVTMIQSKHLSDQLSELLDIDTKYVNSPVFTVRNTTLAKFVKKARTSIQKASLSTSSLRQIALLLALRTLFAFRRWAFGFGWRLRGRVAYELLFDYSIGIRGYEREIHRDSDSRDIVFLLYLNSTESVEGGLLQLHQLKKGGHLKPQPDPADCILHLAIEPKAGTLVAFQNTANSYHSVRRILGENTQRHFLYGGFTRLRGRSDSFRGQSHLATDWTLYN